MVFLILYIYVWCNLGIIKCTIKFLVKKLIYYNTSLIAMSFNKICKDIKSLRIQGAENIAKAGIKALRIRNDSKAIRKLISQRPTEPALRNTIKFIKDDPKKLGKLALKHFKESNKIISKYGARLIKKNSTIFTHCHSSAVIKILKEAKKTKKFQVYNTETRPLYQGRTTAKDLLKLKIPVTHFIDSAGRIAIKDCQALFFGVDAITSDGKVVNKIGTEMFCEIAFKYDIPVYFCTNSWKFDPDTVRGFQERIEERPPKEIWPDAPRKLKIKNYAFEFIKPQLVTAIISELGVYKPQTFIQEVKKTYPWML